MATLPKLPGDPRNLQVSSGGTVWARLWDTSAGAGIALLDGSWRTFVAAEFGIRRPYAWSFALDGEDVWAADFHGVLRWDGQRWNRYSEVASETESSIAASHGQI